jgi:uncharacterized protein (DUF2062 family)
MTKKKKSRLTRFFEYRILHIDDSPHKIALGLAIGLFIAWTPLLGLHIFLVLIIAMISKANKFAALVSVWVSNVFTFAVIYYPSYLVGKAICDIFPRHRVLNREQVSTSFNKLFAPMNMLTGFYREEYWSQFWIFLKKIGPELWIGCLILGGLAAVGSYLVCYNLIKSRRTKNPHRRYEKY